MIMTKTGVINRKDGKSTLNFKCSCGRVHRAVATLALPRKGYSQPTVEVAVEELSLHILSPEGEASKIADAVQQAGPPEYPKCWIPRFDAGTWGIGYYEGDAWEGDGGPFTHAEALRLVKWLNEQETQRCK